MMNFRLSFSLFTVFALISLSSCGQVQSDTFPAQLPPFQKCTTVPMPKTLTFAGETIPLDRSDVREALHQELIVNTYKHSSTIKVLRNIDRWKSFVTTILKEQDVPEDFIYLAIIESEFDNNAKSVVGASGMWQIMEETAKEYKLEINDDVDMRRDPKLATEAACRFLKQANSNFNNWVNTAASYNVGIKGMLNRLNNQKQQSFFDLYLNPETARYVYRILALKVIVENPEAYGFFIPDEDKYGPYKFKTVTVTQDIHNLVDFARENNCSYKELRILNPWFNNSTTFSLKVAPGKSYEIRIPVK
ncbi:MAG: lytic transglycosylase domain-containing protein [Cytophagaceae bacterium]